MVKFLHNRKIQICIIQIVICSIAFPIFAGLKSGNKQDEISSSEGSINDFEHVFTRQEIVKLESIVHEIRKSTTMEIAVVTLDTASTTSIGFDSTTNYIAKQWRMGNKIKKTGILIGVSKSIGKVTIQNANKMEEKISEEQAGKIVDSVMLPEFERNNPYEAVRLGMLALYDQTK